MAALLPLSALPVLLLVGCLLLVLRSLGSLRGLAARGTLAGGAPATRQEGEAPRRSPGLVSALVSMLAVGGMVVVGGLGALGCAVGGLGISRGLSDHAEESAPQERAESLSAGSEQLTVHTTSPLEPGALEVSLSRALGRAVMLAEADQGEGPRRTYHFVLAPEGDDLAALP
ncbi:MAG: hypothetical protein ISQ08_08115 [Planctomycetes bacterium]|nr:hypothetical protein [Planctomycetota bacterium]